MSHVLESWLAGAAALGKRRKQASPSTKCLRQFATAEAQHNKRLLHLGQPEKAQAGVRKVLCAVVRKDQLGLGARGTA